MFGFCICTPVCLWKTLYIKKTSKKLKINIDIQIGYAKIKVDSSQSNVERDWNQVLLGGER